MENVIGMQPCLSAKKRFCAGKAKARIVESYEALCFRTEPFCPYKRRKTMETRLALIGIIVGKRDETTKLNELLHEYGQYIVGRMGIPYKDKDINVISIIIDAPQDTISALSGKLGMLPDVSTKTIYPPLPQQR